MKRAWFLLVVPLLFFATRAKNTPALRTFIQRENFLRILIYLDHHFGEDHFHKIGLLVGGIPTPLKNISQLG